MTSNVTYLLGAGASAGTIASGPNGQTQRENGIPIVREFLQALRDLGQRTRDGITNGRNSTIDTFSNYTTRDVENLIFGHCNNITAELSNFSSIDTYARFLFLLQRDEQLSKLKALIDFSFKYWQATYGIDKRYDSFFSLLLNIKNETLQLPSNLKILTWNYDLQMEACLGRYFEKERLDELESCIRIIPTSGESNPPFGFSIIKLNGSAGVFINQDKIQKRRDTPIKIFNRVNPNDDERTEMYNSYHEIITTYYHSQKVHDPWQPYITWSWEQTEPSKEILREASNIASETDILVVIGYSFPLINRIIDQMLFGQMKRLRKIYLQAPAESIFEIRERCISLLKADNNPLLFKQISLLDPSSTLKWKQVLSEDSIFNKEAIKEFYVPDEIFDK